MSSFSQSTNSSSSSPVQTPQNALIDAISGVASGLAQQMNQWAQQTFAKTSAVTDQTVGNFFQASQQMMGLAGNMTSQYNNLFAPENAQLVQDANDYASPEHMAVDMGSAGATQAQAGAAGVQNSEQNLIDMGIDPSSGRYAALDKAAAVQNAANVAGAENIQRNTDITTGQGLRAEAVQVGAQLPSAISNATNTAVQANTGAENATLGNANTGASLQALANQYLSTAMGIKLPPNASVGSGQSTSTASKPSQPSSGAGQGGGQGGGQNVAGSGPSSWSGMAPNPGAQVGTFKGAGAQAGPAPNYSTGDMLAGVDSGQWTSQAPMYNADPNGASMTVGQPGSASDPTQYIGGGTSPTDPFANQGFGQTLDPSSAAGGGQADQTFGNMSGGTDTQLGNISYDPSANQTSDYSSYGNYSQPDTSVYTDPGAGTAYQDYGQPTPDMSGSYTDPNAGSTYSDPNSYSGDSSGGGGDSSYAGGGPVQPGPAQTTGGPVSPQMSPSGGARTDDVRANLNANEFVVPKDVAQWKGQEFFHNLIAQSRDKRLKMQQALGTGAKPMAPGDPRGRGAPQFNSRPMGAR
jgi:hypothetical protein